jgi:hypothetical protein
MIVGGVTHEPGFRVYHGTTSLDDVMHGGPPQMMEVEERF